MKNYGISNLVFDRANQQRKPINGTFELTSNCNFNCKMCYVHSCKKSSNASLEDWSRAIDEAYENGLMYALITGGEPLIHRSFSEIYSHIYQKGLVSVLNTNGYLIDNYIEFLKKMPPSRINITLYGSDDETYKNLCGMSGGFTTVEKNIRALKENGFNLNLNMTIVKSNVHQVSDMIAFAKENKISVRPTTYVFPSSENETAERLNASDAAETAIEIYRLTHGEDELKKHAENVFLQYEEAKKNPASEPAQGTLCRAGKSSYWIHSDGRLSFCGMTDYGNELNVFKDDFSTAWNCAVASADEVKEFTACSCCEYRFVCKRCFAMLATENVNENNIHNSYTCQYYKAYTEKLLNLHLKG